MQLFGIYEQLHFHLILLLQKCLKISPSPDRSGILFLAPLARKRYSGWLEIAPKN